MSVPQPADSNLPITQLAKKGVRGRWKWCALILLIACVAQAILWKIWWEDPTHFKMSILFVWPAAIFAISIWWIFFSGWSWFVRLGVVAMIVAPLIGLLATYRLEWDGDMVPRRFVLRSMPTREEVARQFLKELPGVDEEPSISSDDQSSSETAPLVETAGDWPGFRGPKRDGIVRGASMRHDWDSKPPREVWRHPVGRAWSSFAIIGVYAFTQEQRDGNECVVAYDVETGKQRWVHADEALLSIVAANGGPGPHATPQFDDGLIYSLGGTGLLNCLKANTGKVVWSTDILKDAGKGKEAPKPEWGVSISPLIVDDLVIVVPGGSEKEDAVSFNRGVAAYDKKSGDLKWAVGKHAASYGSPCVETIGGIRQILVPNANGLSGHSIETGEELWFFPLENGPHVNTAMPCLVGTDSLVFGTGYGVGSVRIDITKNKDHWEAVQHWASNRFRPKFNDFIVRDGFAYGLDDGTLCCLDVESGSIKWKAGRYGYGQLLLVDDVLIVISEDGDLLLIPALPKKQQPLASMKLFDSGFCWNHLAFAHGRLFARNANEAVCLDVSDTKDSPARSDPETSKKEGD